MGVKSRRSGDLPAIKPDRGLLDSIRAQLDDVEVTDDFNLSGWDKAKLEEEIKNTFIPYPPVCFNEDDLRKQLALYERLNPTEIRKGSWHDGMWRD